MLAHISDSLGLRCTRVLIIEVVENLQQQMPLHFLPSPECLGGVMEGVDYKEDDFLNGSNLL